MNRIDMIVGLFGGTVIYKTREAAMTFCGYATLDMVQTYSENGTIIGYY